MQNPFLEGSNPVLTRELRVVLRNTRTFMLLAIYVAVLGAIVLSQFPSDAPLSLSSTGVDTALQESAQRGRDLMWQFALAQALMVWVLVPSLATGALAQERERDTLEPLLLSPLTPLQIVWGKAAGVLSLTGLLLLCTLPLTSLCFLLGGVAPGELAGIYAMLLALSLFFTSIGLFCAAKWRSPLKATLWCYVLVGLAIPVCILLSGPGILVSGLVVIGYALKAFFDWFRAWPRADGVRRWGLLGRAVLWVIGLTLAVLVIRLLVTDSNTRGIVLGFVFVGPYLFFVARLVLQSAAHEIAKRPDPARPGREWAGDMREEWKRAMAPPPVVYTHSSGGQFSYTPLPGNVATTPANASSTAAQSTLSGATTSATSSVATTSATSNTRQSKRDTYDVANFISDRINPILGKDLRQGMAGRTDTFFRYGYIVTIGSEVLLLLYLMLAGGGSVQSEQSLFLGWAYLQLLLLMTACAWLGSRAIAPEREQQVLPQLLSSPLSPFEIVGGKIASVLIFSFYVWMLSVPFLILLPLLNIVSWRLSLSFGAIEAVFGFLLASWGVFCSMHCVTMRRAIGWSMGGVIGLLLGGGLLRSLLDALQAANIGDSGTFSVLRKASEWLSPVRVLGEVARDPSDWIVGSMWPAGEDARLGALMATLAVVLLLAGALLMWTARAFRHYMQTV